MKYLTSNKNTVMICVLLVIFCTFFLVYIQNEYFIKEKNIILKNDTKTHIINSNAITMMYETASGSGEYETTTDTLWPREGYIFNERLSGCENGGTLTWNSETNKVIMESNTSDRCYVYFDVFILPSSLADVCFNGENLANCVKLLYTKGGEGLNGLYYHDGVGSYTNASQEAGDNSYRYSGADPNNYVCFGSDAETCPNEYLYRIIGAFDEDSDGEYSVKLIKADYTTSAMLGTNGRDYVGNYDGYTANYKGSMDINTIGAYRWNYDTSVNLGGSNNWATSELNKTNLNTNYINYLGSSWSFMIEDSTWYLGGMTSSSKTAKSFYIGERNNAGYGSNPIKYGLENANGNSTKIGLMYVSDYGYAAYPDAWTTNLNSYSSTAIIQNNWLYMGIWEWLITPDSSDSDYVFVLNFSGRFVSAGASIDYVSVRPVFYLKPNISYVGGNGTKSDPIRIN